MIVCASAHCQTFTLPSDIFDRMVFEVRKSRICDTLQRSQQIEINAITAQLTTQGRIISLKDSHIASLEAIVASQANELKQTGTLYGLEKERFKAKLKRLWRVVVIESGVIVVILVVLII